LRSGDSRDSHVSRAPSSPSVIGDGFVNIERGTVAVRKCDFVFDRGRMMADFGVAVGYLIRRGIKSEGYPALCKKIGGKLI